MRTINPYLNFDGNTLEAFEFYRSVFGGEFIHVFRFRDFGGGMGETPEAELDRIAHVGLQVGRTMLMGTDTLPSRGQTLTQGNNFYLHLEAESEEEAEHVFTALSEGGRVEMSLSQTEWADKYGICVDRFGMGWMVDYGGNASLAAPQG